MSTTARPEPGFTRFVSPPWQWLAAAALALVIALWLLLRSPLHQTGLHLLGYLLSGVAGTCLVALYRRGDVQRRSNPFYSPMPALDALARAVAVAAVVLAGFHAWALATVWST